MAQTCASIAPVQPILQRVSCSNETLPNASKHYEAHQNISLWSNGVHQSSLRKIPMRFHGTNLCINCTSSTRFAPSWQMHSNTTKTRQNMSLGSNGVDRVHSLPKIPMRVRGRNFCINCTSSAYSHRVSCNNETNQNAPKHYKTHKNMSLGSNGVDQVRSLPKIPMRVRGIKFCVNCISSAVWQRVSCSNEKNPK